MLHEWGESDRSLEPGIEEAIWNRLPETPSFTQRLQKRSLTGWMGWLNAAKEHDKAWHSRAAACMFMGFVHGWMKQALQGSASSHSCGREMA